MPMPKPEQSESQDDFIGRCAADETMQAEYPDEKQRTAVCANIFRQHDKEAKARNEGNEIVAEVFAEGTWNGMSFSTDDLQSIVNAFQALGDQHRVPLKFGHNDEQPMTDGQPAIGWVDEVWAENGKLFARFVAVPDVVFEAIKAGRYRNVSVEIDLDVEHRGQHYDAVLSGVALLGADLPAVNVLEDLRHYMTRPQRGYTASRTAMFTAINREESDMADDKTKEELDKARSDFDREKKAREDAEAKLARLEAEKKEREEADRKAHFKAKREEFQGRLDKLVKAEKILPAKRDELMAKFDEDDSKVEGLAFTIEALEEAVGKVDDTPDGREKAREFKREDDDKPADIRFARECRRVQREKKVSYKDAARIVADEQPELHQEWVDMDLRKEA